LLAAISIHIILGHLGRIGTHLRSIAVAGAAVEGRPMVIQVHVVHGTRPSTGNADLEEIRELQHGPEDRPASKRGTMDADAADVHEGMTLGELSNGRNVVIQHHGVELAVGLVQKFSGPVRRAPRINDDADKTKLCQASWP